MINSTTMLGISLTVSNLERSSVFYRDALGFVPIGNAAGWIDPLIRDGRSVRREALALGEQRCELVEFYPQGEPYPRDSNAADLWFQHFAIVTSDMATAWRQVMEHGATPISRGGPQRLPEAAGGVVCFKFRDPDGHPLELIEFPSSPGDAAWQNATPRVTMGIDHSAISVSDSARSIEFYRTLGLVERTRQVNLGPAQDHLDGLAGVAVEVIGLGTATASLPHLELLCYRTPLGRSRDGDIGAIADSRLIFRVTDLSHHLPQVAPKAACLSDTAEAQMALLQDPDGHAIVLIEDP